MNSTDVSPTKQSYEKAGTTKPKFWTKTTSRPSGGACHRPEASGSEWTAS